MTIILRFPGNVSWTSCRVLTWSTFPCGSCLTFWPRTCGLPRVWSTSTSSTRSAGSRRWSSSAGTRTSSSGRWGPGRGWCRHLTLHCCRHGTPAYREPRWRPFFKTYRYLKGTNCSSLTHWMSWRLLFFKTKLYLSWLSFSVRYFIRYFSRPRLSREPSSLHVLFDYENNANVCTLT